MKTQLVYKIQRADGLFRAAGYKKYSRQGKLWKRLTDAASFTWTRLRGELYQAQGWQAYEQFRKTAKLDDWAALLPDDELVEYELVEVRRTKLSEVMKEYPVRMY